MSTRLGAEGQEQDRAATVPEMLEGGRMTENAPTPVDCLMVELGKLKQQIHDTQVICEWARRELERLNQPLSVQRRTLEQP